jgi:hypothetical protein
MKFDFKVTTWERITIDTDQEEKVLQAIKNGSINSVDDIYTLLEQDGDANIETEMLLDFCEQMSLVENGGCSTIEVYDDNGEQVFKNGK